MTQPSASIKTLGLYLIDSYDSKSSTSDAKVQEMVTEIATNIKASGVLKMQTCIHKIFDQVVDFLIISGVIEGQKSPKGHYDVKDISDKPLGPKNTNPAVPDWKKKQLNKRVPRTVMVSVYSIICNVCARLYDDGSTSSKVSSSMMPSPPDHSLKQSQKPGPAPKTKPKVKPRAPPSLNVHDYDGKWDVLIKDYMAKTKPQCTFDEAISGIKAKVEKYSEPVYRATLLKNLETLVKTRKDNVDPANLANAETIIMLLWDKVKDSTEADELIFEQIKDLSGGFCAQGRTTRFAQILLAMVAGS